LPDGRVVAVLDCELQHWNNVVLLWNLMVDESYRGQGIGRRLWERGLDFARQVGARALTLETQNTNIAACKFYQRMGCELIGINELLYMNDWRTAESGEFALFWAYKLR
jgi:ribosomal protein S18 acetylase RimI-like enzyme